MCRAMLIGLGVCAGAAADETYTTFGNPWAFTTPIHLMGQTMVVPDTCTEMKTFEFVTTSLAQDIPYIVAVYDWSEEDQHVVGDALFAKSGMLSPDEPAHKQMDIGVNLPEGETIAVIIAHLPDDGAEYGAAYTLSDAFANGSFIGTYGASDEEWLFQEDDEYDLLFEIQWGVCKADMYADGVLNIFDFLVFENAFKNGLESADFDDNGVLNVLDFVAFQAAFQACLTP